MVLMYLCKNVFKFDLNLYYLLWNVICRRQKSVAQTVFTEPLKSWETPLCASFWCERFVIQHNRHIRGGNIFFRLNKYNDINNTVTVKYPLKKKGLTHICVVWCNVAPRGSVLSQARLQRGTYSLKMQRNDLLAANSFKYFGELWERSRKYAGGSCQTPRCHELSLSFLHITSLLGTDRQIVLI